MAQYAKFDFAKYKYTPLQDVITDRDVVEISLHYLFTNKLISKSDYNYIRQIGYSYVNIVTWALDQSNGRSIMSGLLEVGTVYNHIELVKLVLSHHTDPNPALFDAITFDRLEIVNLLLAYGADPTYISVKEQLTPLELSIQTCGIGMTSALLAYMNVPTDRLNHLLGLAFEANDIDQIRLFLERELYRVISYSISWTNIMV